MKLEHLALAGLGLYLLTKTSTAAGVTGGGSSSPSSTPPVTTTTTTSVPTFANAKEGYTYFHNALNALGTWARQQRNLANTDINAQIRAIENNAMRNTAGQGFVNPVTGLRDTSVDAYLQSLYKAAGANTDVISAYVTQQRSYLYGQQEYYRRQM